MVIGFKPHFETPILKGDKVHTMRDCNIYKWKPGTTMHMATGVRTRNYRCFKETPFVSGQQVFMTFFDELIISVDGKRLSIEKTKELIKKDGFESEEQFTKWFFPKGSGKCLLTLLHWTDLKY